LTSLITRERCASAGGCRGDPGVVQMVDFSFVGRKHRARKPMKVRQGQEGRCGLQLPWASHNEDLRRIPPGESGKKEKGSAPPVAGCPPFEVVYVGTDASKRGKPQIDGGDRSRGKSKVRCGAVLFHHIPLSSITAGIDGGRARNEKRCKRVSSGIRDDSTSSSA